MVLMIGELEADVNNGGFQQYLENKGSARARAALAVLVAVGAAGTARLLSSALKRARDVNALDRLDQRFYESGEDLPTRVMRCLGEAVSERCRTRR